MRILGNLELRWMEKIIKELSAAAAGVAQWVGWLCSIKKTLGLLPRTSESRCGDAQL